METQSEVDHTGEPVAVRLAPLNLTVKEPNPLDWYKLTESLNSILNGVISMASREHMKELDRARPDEERINSLVALRDEVFELNNDPLNFKSLTRMEELIDIYSPILKRNVGIKNLKR